MQGLGADGGIGARFCETDTLSESGFDFMSYRGLTASKGLLLSIISKAKVTATFTMLEIDFPCNIFTSSRRSVFRMYVLLMRK